MEQSENRVNGHRLLMYPRPLGGSKGPATEAEGSARRRADQRESAGPVLQALQLQQLDDCIFWKEAFLLDAPKNDLRGGKQVRIRAYGCVKVGCVGWSSTYTPYAYRMA